MKVITSNRRALKDHKVLQKFEAGVKLTGSEVKSLKQGRGKLDGSYIKMVGGNVVVVGMNIPKYSSSSQGAYDPIRTRNLLLNKNEIHKLNGLLSQKGFTAFPTKVYLKNNLIKLEIGVGTHLKKYQKKEKLKERQEQRDLDRDLRGKV